MSPSVPQPSLSPALALAFELIARPSVSPDDQGCQQLIAERLNALGFQLEWFEHNGVTNLWATHGKGTTLAFAGHTDVVPAGPAEQWQTPPFEPVIDEHGYLRGRGASDMKGGVAAFVTAVTQYVERSPQHTGRLALLLTSDEEGPAIDGTRLVIDALSARGEGIDYCVVGEPSSSLTLGDTIKNGRRGSLGGHLVVNGIQGHVAYPDKARNPIHMISAALSELVSERWDDGNDFFPATTFQISNFTAGTGATNVVPGRADIRFNFRFSTESSAEQLMTRTEAILQRHGLHKGEHYQLDWALSGQPFLTEPGNLVNAAQQSIQALTGTQAELSTSGGTSDGRFIATLGGQVIELGVNNDTIHQVDERVLARDIDTLTRIYEGIITRLLGSEESR
ncbi:succinyl-diaminopimelate desuccinylase [Carnimonas bestiolae]|uniref:succinyl-diaminopimelate desuccinylase n=1 Tax=Carnimonas bestiolae TaxID=3402172 RepID=UPI003EDC649E